MMNFMRKGSRGPLASAEAAAIEQVEAPNTGRRVNHLKSSTNSRSGERRSHRRSSSKKDAPPVFVGAKNTTPVSPDLYWASLEGADEYTTDLFMRGYEKSKAKLEEEKSAYFEERSSQFMTTMESPAVLYVRGSTVDRQEITGWENQRPGVRGLVVKQDEITGWE